MNCTERSQGSPTARLTNLPIQTFAMSSICIENKQQELSLLCTEKKQQKLLPAAMQADKGVYRCVAWHHTKGLVMLCLQTLFVRSKTFSEGKASCQKTTQQLPALQSNSDR